MAHQDGTVLKAQIGQLVIDFREQDLKIPIQAIAATTALEGLASKESAGRYLQHIRAAFQAVGNNLFAVLDQVCAAVRKYPDLQHGQKSLPQFEGLKLPDGAKAFPPVSSDPFLTTIEVPGFPVPPETYLWRRNVVTRTPLGKYEWIGSDGKPAWLDVFVQPVTAP